MIHSSQPSNAWHTWSHDTITQFEEALTITISYEDMRFITQVYQIAKSEKSISGTIFLAKTDIAYGIARMLHTLHQIANEHHTVKIVRSEEELNETIEQLRSNQ